MTYSILTSSKQLQTLLEVIALLALVLAFLLPRLFAGRFHWIEEKCGFAVRRPWMGILFAALIPMVVRLAILPVFPQPLPFVHDEFSYLLMSDTFAHGRVTNVTPPEWRHFETEYVLLHPTYASQYQPAQGLVLAAGQVITGEPWWGVWASIGLMCGTLCWALSYQFGMRWALCGALGAALQFGIFGFWMNSYFGGAIAATGGALVGGALLRMRKRPLSSAIICAAGFIVLLASRPAEGLLWGAAAFIWIAVAYRKRFPAIILTAAPVCVAGIAGLAYYNFRVTGNALRPPYEAGRIEYGTPQSFWWQPAILVTRFGNPQLRDNYLNQLAFWNRRYSVAALWDSTWRRLRDFWRFFIGPFLTPALFFLWFVWRDRRIRPWIYVSIPFVFEHATFHAWYPQHSAAETFLIVVILLQGWRHLRVWKRRRGWGLAMSRNLAVGFSMAIVLVTIGRASEAAIPARYSKVRAIWGTLTPVPRMKDRALAVLEQTPGKHLVFVRYAPSHPYIDEWVFNKASIPGTRVVFARLISPESDAALIRAMEGYDVWIAEPDSGLLSRLPDANPEPSAASAAGSAAIDLNNQALHQRLDTSRDVKARNIGK